MIIVFYDGKCGLCSQEIKFYRKFAPKAVFQWFDISNSNKELEKRNIKCEDALMALHVIDDKGMKFVGIDAFIVIWSELKYFKTLAKFISLPIVKQCTSFIYKKFTSWRFKRLNYCEINKQNDIYKN